MWNWLKKHVFKRRNNATRNVGANATRNVGANASGTVGANAFGTVGDNTIGEVGANASFYKSCTDGVILYNKQQEQLVQSGHKTKTHRLNESEVCGTDELTPMYVNSKMAPVNHYLTMDNVPYERNMKFISKKYHDALVEKTKNTGFYSPEHKARWEARQFKGGRSRRKRRTRARRTRRYSKNLF